MSPKPDNSPLNIFEELEKIHDDITHELTLDPQKKWKYQGNYSYRSALSNRKEFQLKELKERYYELLISIEKTFELIDNDTADRKAINEHVSSMLWQTHAFLSHAKMVLPPAEYPEFYQKPQLMELHDLARKGATLYANLSLDNFLGKNQEDKANRYKHQIDHSKNKTSETNLAHLQNKNNQTGALRGKMAKTFLLACVSSMLIITIPLAVPLWKDYKKDRKKLSKAIELSSRLYGLDYYTSYLGVDKSTVKIEKDQEKRGELIQQEIEGVRSITQPFLETLASDLTNKSTYNPLRK